MAQILRPDSDISNDGSWHASSSYVAIDEETYIDTDYLLGLSDANGTIEIGVQNGTDPGVSTGHIVRFRAYQQNKTFDRGLVCDLVQGSTVIATYTVSAPLPKGTTSTLYTLTLSESEANSITDYTDLRLRFTSTGNIGTPASGRAYVYVSWAEIEIPDYTQNNDLTTQDLTGGVPVIDQITVSQEFSLTTQDLTGGAAVIDQTTVEQSFDLATQDITADNPVIDSITVEQQFDLTPQDITAGVPVIDSTTVGQPADLTTQDLVAGVPVIDSTTVEQQFDILTQDLTGGAAVIDSTTVEQQIDLVTQDLTAGVPIIDSTTVEQQIDLATQDIVAGTPTIDQINVDQGDVTYGTLEVTLGELTFDAELSQITGTVNKTLGSLTATATATVPYQPAQATYVSSAGAYNSGTSVTIDAPAGITEGDLLVAILHCNNVVTITDNNGSYPFTAVYGDAVNSTAATYRIFYRVATASEPSTYTFNTSVSNRFSGIIAAYRDVDSGIFDVTPDATTHWTAIDSSVTTESITTGSDNSIVLSVGFVDSSVSVSGVTPPSGFTLDITQTPQNIMLAHLEKPTAGVVASGTFTYTAGSLPVASQTFALLGTGLPGLDGSVDKTLGSLSASSEVAVSVDGSGDNTLGTLTADSTGSSTTSGEILTMNFESGVLEGDLGETLDISGSPSPSVSTENAVIGTYSLKVNAPSYTAKVYGTPFYEYAGARFYVDLRNFTDDDFVTKYASFQTFPNTFSISLYDGAFNSATPHPRLRIGTWDDDGIWEIDYEVQNFEPMTYCFEVLLTRSSASDVADGRYDFWINGTLVASRTGIILWNRIDQINLYGLIGSFPDSTFPFYFDAFVFRNDGQYIGLDPNFVYHGNTDQTLGTLTADITVQPFSQELTVQDLTAGTPVIEQTAVEQQFDLTTQDITGGTPVIEQTTIGQTFDLVTQDITAGVPVIEAILVDQPIDNSLTAQDITAGTPVIEQTSIGQVFAIMTLDLTAGIPIIDQTTVDQGFEIDTQDIVSGIPIIDQTSIDQSFELVVQDITAGVPVIEATQLGQIFSIETQDITGGIPVIDPVTVVQIFVLLTQDIVAGVPIIHTTWLDSTDLSLFTLPDRDSSFVLKTRVGTDEMELPDRDSSFGLPPRKGE